MSMPIPQMANIVMLQAKSTCSNVRVDAKLMLIINWIIYSRELTYIKVKYSNIQIVKINLQLMTSPRQIQTALTKKFLNTISTNFTLKGVSVGSKLRQDIQRETQRLEKMMKRKVQTQRRINQKNQQQLNHRLQLKNKIVKDIDEHTQHRQQFLLKRIKDQKMKSQFVQKTYVHYQQAELQKKKTRRNQFQKFKDHMEIFWEHKKQKQEDRMKVQISVKPQHSNAVERKKRSESLNQRFALKTRSKLLDRHSPSKERVIELFNRKKEEIHDVHSNQMSKNQNNYLNLLSQRQNHYVNTIGIHHSRSENLLKQNKTEYQKRLQKTSVFQKDTIERIRSAFTQRKKEKVIRLSSCKCWTKGKQKMNTNSVVLNEEQAKGSDIKQKPRFKREFSNSLEQSRNSFLQSSQMTFNRVKNQQQNLIENQRAMSQRRLMRQNQISKGLRLRKQILNEANCLIRKARFVKREGQQTQAKTKL